MNGNLIMLSSDGRVQHCRVAAPMAVEPPRATVAAATKPAAAPEAAPEADKEAPADADAPKPDA